VIVRPFVQRNERTERLDAPAANALLIWRPKQSAYGLTVHSLTRLRLPMKVREGVKIAHHGAVFHGPGKSPIDGSVDMMRSWMRRLRGIVDTWSVRFYLSPWWWFAAIVGFLVLLGIIMVSTADCRARGLPFYECGPGSP